MLNAKQKRFCEEYILDSNATQASIRAGYSEKTAYSIGSENLKKPEILAEIRRLNELITDSRILQSKDIQILLSERIREELNSDGLKAIDILNKMQGNYTEKIEVTEVKSRKVIVVEEDE